MGHRHRRAADRCQDWGDAVEVRYGVANPSQALVADFQNMWGGVWALGRFGGSAVRRFEFRIIFAIVGLGFLGFGFGAWKMM